MNICTNYSASISKKDNILKHYQAVDLAIDLQENIKFHVQFIWNELFMLQICGKTSAEFLKKRSIPIFPTSDPI